MDRSELLTSLRDERDPLRRRLVMLGLLTETLSKSDIEHWKSDEDGRWCRRLALLYSDRVDWGYLR